MKIGKQYYRFFFLFVRKIVEVYLSALWFGHILYICDGSGTRNRIFGYLEPVGKWGWGKLNKAFLFFPQIFGIFDDISKFHSTFGLLHFEKSPNGICICLLPQSLKITIVKVSITYLSWHESCGIKIRQMHGKNIKCSRKWHWKKLQLLLFKYEYNTICPVFSFTFGGQPNRVNTE